MVVHAIFDSRLPDVDCWLSDDRQIFPGVLKQNAQGGFPSGSGFHGDLHLASVRA